ncbi:gamma-glutamylcyclotransferase family protein [Vibrio sonorensis]|uniref:gamma-glutamylcyclotransferase family protein n=1 Tax=Vibrio sonorensis TaxID=1004316 RepID=UPI0008DAABE2|nr:gamma-glutamylcyclotransferase family protein [Vibrio sonorensis]
MSIFIFGYGSLINSASRRLTGQTSDAVTAVAEGFMRYWGKVDDSYILAPLVVNRGEGSVNGVLLKVDQAGLLEFDRRERGYQRVLIKPEQLTTSQTIAEEDEVWVYIKQDPEPPCSLSPIMQSYVDTVLAGCLEISEAFAREFVEHTLGWHFPWEDDRDSPKYGNLAGVTEAHHNQIDSLIAEARS